MALRISGFDVFVYSRTHANDNKENLVMQIGAHYVAAEKNTIDDLAKQAGPIDVVYEAVGASGVAFETIKHLGPNGVFIFTGVPGHKGPIEVDTDFIMKDVVLGNQVILGSVNAPPQCFEAAIRDLGTFVERWPAAVRALITARFPIQKALDPLAEGFGGIKNVIAVSA